MYKTKKAKVGSKWLLQSLKPIRLNCLGGFLEPKTREDQDLGFGQFAREDHELGCGPAFGLGSQHLVCGPGFRLRTTDREGQDLASEPGFGFRTAGREDQHLGSGPAFGLGGQD